MGGKAFWNPFQELFHPTKWFPPISIMVGFLTWWGGKDRIYRSVDVDVLEN